MKTHSNGFKENIKTLGRELDSIITYTLNGETIELGSEQLNSVTPHYDGGILKSVMKQLDIDSNEIIPIGTIINYQFGVKVNNTYEYLDFGNYMVYDVQRQEDTRSYTITCYDKMLLTMKDYVQMPITYPITVRNYINTLCQFNFLTFANSSDTFANYDKIIPNELYLDSNGGSLGYTFRDVFDELAQVTGSTICINEDDELEIRYLNNTNDTIDEEYFKDINVEFGEKYGPINSVVLSRAGGSDNIYLRDEGSVTENGLCEIKISDNQIMSKNDRDEYLQDILDAVDGIEYYLNDFSSTGICYYDLCDKYNISIGENTYNCVMFNDEIDITQGLEEHIHTDRPEESVTDYTKADKTDRKINQTYIMVDKQNGVIDALASSVQDLTDFLKTVQGTGEITLDNTPTSNGAIGRIEITGLTELGLYPGMEYPSNNVYPGKLTTYVIIQENEDGTEHNETYIDLGVSLIATDKLIIENNKVSVQRINGDITTDIEVIFKTYETKTKISVKYFNDANIKCQYIEKNDFTKYFATQTQLSSQLIITDESISTKVSKAEVVSEINQSAEEIKINAGKISLEGLVTANKNFVIDENGSMECNDASIKGTAIVNESNDRGFRLDKDGNVYMRGDPDSGNSVFKIVNDTYEDRYTEILPNWIRMNRDGLIGLNIAFITRTPMIQLTDGSNTTSIIPELIATPQVIQTSLAESKKNFEKLENGLSIIKDTDIYKYNLKSQENGSKKHIGLVIGDEFNYSKEVTSENNDGVDTYSMVAVCFKAIQELNEKIEKLEEKLKESEKNG